ncbi:MAG: sulfide/dihydroorotate dehydrogenase-like FAD/NAD-binding protein [bacterium]|jgi:ferredoxin--NADP+ reductase|nr:sulfide/dihydroorotate dehydrogenase-like FAD/NAD-binding protein [bacterium]MDD3804671.1 sulfide/dihydroorotate dehydrogenase-like FAD/NAD-binding protein [bacterium]MDD4557460.1 sulfide/dihydroorotate dehydrogenase-like FAD/NAD-binding protein [bacterium]
MYKIEYAADLAESIKLLVVLAPMVAAKAQAGHFVVVRNGEKGERIPLTIAGYDRQKGTITLVVQSVGKSSSEICALQEGDALTDVLGPLGHATHIERVGTVLCVAGGVGVAPVYPIAKAFKEAGNRLISVIGARSKDLIFFQTEMKAVSDVVHYTTDDGSYGLHGFVTDAVKNIVEGGEKVDKVIAIGPLPMMKAVADLTRNYGISTVVSLNALMVDGTGMCGGCRVTVGGETKFSCVDGPDFDGHKVDFAELLRRQTRFSEEEKMAYGRYRKEEHKCRIR